MGGFLDNIGLGHLITKIKNELNNKADKTHTHGNITSGGTLQTTDVTIENGDKIVVTDANDTNKVARSSVSFDASTTTKALTQKGTWENVVNSVNGQTGVVTIEPDILYVTFDISGENPTCDTSISDIVNAIESGKYVYGTAVALENLVLTPNLYVNETEVGVYFNGILSLNSIVYLFGLIGQVSNNIDTWTMLYEDELIQISNVIESISVNGTAQSINNKNVDITIPVTSVNNKTGDVVLNADDVKAVHDYSKEYLTFTALEDTTFTFTTNALQYSLNGGVTWTTLSANTTSPTVTIGNKILWKQTGLTPTTSNGIGTFSATGNFEASGNIMSLHYGDDFIEQTNLTGKNYAFYRLFYNCNKLVNAENLILPATTLAKKCYWQMFYNCTSLTKSPELPATTLSSECYYGMFYGCIKLSTAPELPATTLAYGCYRQMFYNCTSLTIVPEILPATTLTDCCYEYMFYGCIKLSTAPELPATTLASWCYDGMFYNCTSLNYIKCLATDISATDCTRGWVTNVASSGTFIKSDGMDNWTTGDNGMPSGWSVYTESEYKEVRHYELSSVISGVTHTFFKNVICGDDIKIWIDDFSKINIQEMYDNYVNENSRYKQYHLTQNTLTIDNITYYVWESNDEGIEYDYCPDKAYLLTTTNDYDELLSQSLSEDLNNDFTSFGGFLNEDSEESYIDENYRIQYILNVEQNNNELYIYVDNIKLKGFENDRTIYGYINDPELYGSNPYILTSDTIEIDGETYFIWKRAEYDDDYVSSIYYLLTTTDDYETLESRSLEASKYNLACKPNSFIFAFMGEDNEIYESPAQNIIIKVENV